MMKSKIFSGRGRDLAGLVLVAAVMAGADMFVPLVYGFNDDAMIRSILSGSYSGIPDGHAVYMRYPLTGILSTLYRVSKAVPWLTLFFAICMAVCVFLILKMVCSNIDGKKYRILGGILAAEILTALLARHYFVMHYTIVAALLSGTAILLFLNGRRIGSLALLFLCYMVRNQVLFLALPFLMVAILWEMAEDVHKESLKRKLGECGKYAGVLFLGILLLAGLHKIMYGTPQWQEYQKYNDARTELYDYAGIPPYEKYMGIYEEIGISKLQYQILKEYNTVLDGEISAQQLSRLAHAVQEVNAGQQSTKELFKERFREYYYRTLHRVDFPYNVVVLAFYGVLFLLCIFQRQWLRLGLLAVTGVGRSVIWLYLMMRGRYPERITVSLYLIEGLLLAGLCLGYLKQNAEKTGNGDGRKKWQMVILATIFAVIILWMPITWSELQRGWEDASTQQCRQRQWEELQQYMQQRSEDFFYMDVYSMVEITGMQYETESYENYMLLGGWMTRSVLQQEKQKMTGYESPLQALSTGENFYLVGKEDRNLQWIEEYATSVGISLKLEVYDKVGNYIIYAGAGS